MQGVITLQTKHKTNKQARNCDDRQRVIAQEMNLVADQAEALEAAAQRPEQAQEQARAQPEVSHLAANRKPDIAQFVPAHKLAPKPNSCSIVGPG